MFQSDFSVLDPAGHFISLSPSDLVSLPVAVYKHFILHTLFKVSTFSENHQL